MESTNKPVNTHSKAFLEGKTLPEFCQEMCPGGKGQGHDIFCDTVEAEKGKEAGDKCWHACLECKPPMYECVCKSMVGSTESPGEAPPPPPPTRVPSHATSASAHMSHIHEDDSLPNGITLMLVILFMMLIFIILCCLCLYWTRKKSSKVEDDEEYQTQLMAPRPQDQAGYAASPYVGYEYSKPKPPKAHHHHHHRRVVEEPKPKRRSVPKEDEEEKVIKKVQKKKPKPPSDEEEEEEEECVEEEVCCEPDPCEEEPEEDECCCESTIEVNICS